MCTKENSEKVLENLKKAIEMYEEAFKEINKSTLSIDAKSIACGLINKTLDNDKKLYEKIQKMTK